MVKPKGWLKNSIGDLHFVLPALNVSILDAGILIMMQQARLTMFSLNIVDLLLSTLNFFVTVK